MSEKVGKNYILNVKNLLKCILLSIIITIVLQLVLTFIIYFSNVKENIIDSGIIFISCIAILFSSFLCTKKVKNKGLINGLWIGLIYMGFLYLISSFINMDFSIGLESLIMIILGVICGMIGGIIGVNVKI